MSGCSEQGTPAADRTLPPWLDAAGAAAASGNDAPPAPPRPPAPPSAPDGPLPGAGRWQKGQSGNPAGRPPGRPDARTKITRLLMEDAPAIAAVVTAAALEGDLGAASLVLARVAPALKPETARVAFDFDAAAPITQQIEAVLTAIAAGAVAPDVGREIISALGTLADARAVADLEARIITLEAKEVGR